MSASSPLAPRGKTQGLFASTTPPISAVQVQTLDGVGANNYVLTNFGPDVACIGFGPDATTALLNTTVPSPGYAAYCVVLFPGQQSYSLPPNGYFAAICPRSTATVLIAPGDGTAVGGQLPQIDLLAAMTLSNQLVFQELGVLQDMMVELRTATFYLSSGLSATDDPEQIRSDIRNDSTAVQQ